LTSYLARRLLITIPVLIGITVLTFVFINLAPGDPVMMMVSPEQVAELGQEWLEARRHELGLDQPLPVRYVRWLQELAHGNLGYSLTTGESVAGLIVERLPATLRLLVAALVVGIGIGVPVGVLSAVKQYSLLDYASTIFSMAFIAVPPFFLGLGLIYIFALSLDILPTAGMNTVGVTPTLWDSLLHLVLPATVLGFGQAAQILRYTRSSLLQVLRQDFVRTARAKGLHERVVIYRHALRNALIPVVTVVALNIPALFGGAVITEQIFQWPGVGSLAMASIARRDYSTIMGVNFVSAVLVLLCNLAADVAYSIIDPRIRYR